MKVVCCLFLAIAVSGCSQQGGSSPGQEATELRREIDSLKNSLAVLSDANNELKSRVDAIEDGSEATPKSAFFDPAGGKGYQYVSTNVSPILISFVDSSPIGDGTKIRLRIGNLSTATYSGIRLTVRYNTRFPDDAASIPTWLERMKHAVAQEANELPPGAWTEVEASLPGIKPDSLGHVVVAAELDSLRLRSSQ